MNFGLALPHNQTKNIPNWVQQAEEHSRNGLFCEDASWCEHPMIGIAAAAPGDRRLIRSISIIPLTLVWLPPDVLVPPAVQPVCAQVSGQRYALRYILRPAWCRRSSLN